MSSLSFESYLWRRRTDPLGLMMNIEARFRQRTCCYHHVDFRKYLRLLDSPAVSGGWLVSIVGLADVVVALGVLKKRDSIRRCCMLKRYHYFLPPSRRQHLPIWHRYCADQSSSTEWACRSCMQAVSPCNASCSTGVVVSGVNGERHHRDQTKCSPAPVGSGDQSRSLVVKTDTWMPRIRRKKRSWVVLEAFTNGTTWSWHNIRPSVERWNF